MLKTVLTAFSLFGLLGLILWSHYLLQLDRARYATVQLARGYVSSNSSKLAISLLQSLIDSNSCNKECKLLFGQAHYAINNYHISTKYCMESVDLSLVDLCANYLSWVCLANSYYFTGEYQSASSLYNSILPCSSNSTFMDTTAFTQHAASLLFLNRPVDSLELVLHYKKITTLLDKKASNESEDSMNEPANKANVDRRAHGLAIPGSHDVENAKLELIDVVYLLSLLQLDRHIEGAEFIAPFLSKMSGSKQSSGELNIFSVALILAYNIQETLINSRQLLEISHLMIDWFPSLCSSYYYRGKTQLLLKNPSAAVGSLRLSLSLSDGIYSSQFYALINLGEALTELNDWQNAFGAYREAMQLIADKRLTVAHDSLPIDCYVLKQLNNNYTCTVSAATVCELSNKLAELHSSIDRSLTDSHLEILYRMALKALSFCPLSQRDFSYARLSQMQEVVGQLGNSPSGVADDIPSTSASGISSSGNTSYSNNTQVEEQDPKKSANQSVRDIQSNVDLTADVKSLEYVLNLNISDMIDAVSVEEKMKDSAEIIDSATGNVRTDSSTIDSDATEVTFINSSSKDEGLCIAAIGEKSSVDERGNIASAETEECKNDGFTSKCVGFGSFASNTCSSDMKKQFYDLISFDKSPFFDEYCISPDTVDDAILNYQNDSSSVDVSQKVASLSSTFNLSNEDSTSHLNKTSEDNYNNLTASAFANISEEIIENLEDDEPSNIDYSSLLVPKKLSTEDLTAIKLAQQYISMAKAYETRKNYAQVVKELNKAVHKAPEYPQIYILRGKAYLQLKDIDSAAEDFSLVYKTLDPFNEEAYEQLYLIATYHSQREEFAEANKVFIQLELHEDYLLWKYQNELKNDTEATNAKIQKFVGSYIPVVISTAGVGNYSKAIALLNRHKNDDHPSIKCVLSCPKEISTCEVTHDKISTNTNSTDPGRISVELNELQQTRLSLYTQLFELSNNHERFVCVVKGLIHFSHATWVQLGEYFLRVGDTLAAIDSLQYLLLSRKDNEALQLSITNGSLSSTDKLVQDQAELHKQIGILYSEMLRISLTSTTENATSSNQETLVDSISVPSDNRKALIDHVHYHYGEAIKLGVYDVDIRQFYAEFPLSTVPPSLTAGSSSDVGRIHEIMESNSSIPSQFSKEGSTHHGNGHRWVVRHLAESKEKGILKRKYTVKSLDELPQLPELSLDNLDLARQRLESELADSGEVDGVSGNQVGSSDHGITTTETQRRKSVNNKV